MKIMKIIIIGSGISGLITAAYCTKAGHSVQVFEQYHEIGGVTAGFEKDGYRWDLGQLLLQGFAPDEPIGKIFAELEITEKIPIVKDDRRYVFPDFEITKPSTYGGLRWRLELLKARFPEDATGLERYWKYYIKVMEIMTIGRKLENLKGLSKVGTQIRFYSLLLSLFSVSKWSTDRFMRSLFSNERLRMVFTSILADFVIQPKEFIGLGIITLNQEPTFDTRTPKQIGRYGEHLYHYTIIGGFRTVINALVEYIQTHGGTIQTNSQVDHILIDQNRVNGVQLHDQSIHHADLVIASGGIREFCYNLVGKDHLPAYYVDQVESQRFMESVFMLHLGLDINPYPFVKGVCTYYYGTYAIDESIQKLRTGIYHEGADGFVVHVPTYRTPSMAPQDHHAMTVYTICPNRLREGSWQEKKEIYAKTLLQYVEKHIPGIQNHIRVMEIMTPEDFQHRAYVTHHSFGGIAPILGTKSVTFETPVEGLYFIGSQGKSGAGIDNVAPTTAKFIKKLLEGIR